MFYGLGMGFTGGTSGMAVHLMQVMDSTSISKEHSPSLFNIPLAGVCFCGFFLLCNQQPDCICYRKVI
jgi:hypothetical protein